MADGDCVPCTTAESVPGIAGFAACCLPGSPVSGGLGAARSCWAVVRVAGGAVLCGHNIPLGGLTLRLDCALLLMMLCKCQS